MKRILLLALLSAGPLAAYNPPIGIPNPADTFGWEIDRPTPAWPASWTAPTPSATPNYYYIDKTDPLATDTTNPYGYPGKPRIHLPEGNLPAGTFIYINAGTYTPADSTGAEYDWSGTGTSLNPIWITGNPATHPIFTDRLHIGSGVAQVETATVTGAATASADVIVTVTGAGIAGSPLVMNVTVASGDTAAQVAGKIKTVVAANAAISALYNVTNNPSTAITLTRKATGNDGTLNIAIDGTTNSTGVPNAATSANTTTSISGSTSFLVLENLDVNGTNPATVDIYPTLDSDTVDHVLVRNITRVGTGVANDLQGIGVGNSTSNDTTPNIQISDIVVYNCNISFCGDPSPTGSDDSGVYNAYHTKRVWALDNIVHHVGADGVAGSHYSNYTDKLCEDYYIGRNTLYTNGENGIDLKNVQGFIISENVIYGPFNREQGYAMVFHYGFSTSFHPREGRILGNTIYHCSGGIYTGLSSGMDNVDIIGNKIYDIKAAYAAQADVLNGACIQLGGTTTGANSVFRIVNNTFHDYEMGLKLRPQPGDAIKVHGNIFSSRSSLTGYEIEVDINGREQYITSDYNMFSTLTPAFLWAGGPKTLLQMQGLATPREVHSVTGNASFVDAPAANFHLGPGSNAIDAIPEGPVGDSAYTAFSAFTLLHSFPAVALDIKLDLDRRTRPVDGIWDAGAYESALPPNAPPSSLQVSP